MAKIKVVFIGYSKSAELNLRKLVRSKILKKIDIVALIVPKQQNEKDDYFLSVAKLLYIPIFFDDPNESQLLQFLQYIKPDVCIIHRCRYKLTLPFIKIFRYAINFHPSRLPQLRGGAAPVAVILDQKPLVITAHLLDQQLDTGPIIFQTSPIEITDLYIDEVIFLIGWKSNQLLKKILNIIIKDKKLPLQKQTGDASYFSFADAEKYRVIDWHQNCNDIYHQILTASSEGGIDAHVSLPDQSNKLLRIFRAIPIVSKHGYSTGVLILKINGAYVTCDDGYIGLIDYQIEDVLSSSLKKSK